MVMKYGSSRKALFKNSQCLRGKYEGKYLDLPKRRMGPGK
jgi:hypothetical protein